MPSVNKASYTSFLFCCLFALSVSAAPAEEFAAQIQAVHDGDTLTLLIKGQQERVRLYGIDAPEYQQPWGKESLRFLKQYTGSTIQLSPLARDRYGRLIVVAWLPDGTTLNGQLVTHGMAWVYERYCNMALCSNWKEAQRTAKAKRIGLWSALFSSHQPLPPWQWRKHHKE